MGRGSGIIKSVLIVIIKLYNKVESKSNRKGGKIFLILGPSGTGKGTVIRALRERHPDFVFTLSCTTREPRPNERDGEAYHFVSKEEFARHREARDFLEWAVVHEDNYYGTLKQPILDALADGKVVIREVDIQGVLSIKKLLPAEQTVAIFLTTPSWDNLRARIMRRHAESEEELRQRHESFKKEMEWEKKCDYTVVSEEGKIEEMITEVEGIIEKEMG